MAAIGADESLGHADDSLTVDLALLENGIERLGDALRQLRKLNMRRFQIAHLLFQCRVFFSHPPVDPVFLRVVNAVRVIEAVVDGLGQEIVVRLLTAPEDLDLRVQHVEKPVHVAMVLAQAIDDFGHVGPPLSCQALSGQAYR